MNYSLKPLPGQDVAPDGWTMVSPKTARSSSKGFENYTQALQRSEACNQSRRDAISSAASLYRKGASNPLYRQAASVYAERASEQAGYAQEAMSTAADLFVQGQSTDDSIDLHGVSVQDGVRIARQKACYWWETRGKFKGERRETHTLTIITGLGRHSASGVSQLRQSVAKALKQDGWKVTVETGRFVITGKQ
ncbi:Smr domain-containing protein [Escovopsis weberi]|uniref:Smr domain-containing protein n=1 Tax=Escovopsis weberi TaxID=150374 RepID=A0A0M9VX26_ESCWE|nr:Smr domain-containing protein [Escovopsis weberi]